MKLMSRLNDYIIHSQFDVRTFTLLLHQDEGQRERERAAGLFSRLHGTHNFCSFVYLHFIIGLIVMRQFQMNCTLADTH